MKATAITGAHFFTNPGLLAGALLVALTSLGCSKPKHEAPAPAEKPAQQAKQPESPVAKFADTQKFAALPEMPVPKKNPQTDEKVALGKKLFFDKRLSADGSVACYSCHQDSDGTGGGVPTAIGANEKKLSRHSPTMYNVGYLPALYWDGRAKSLEAQMKGAWAGGNMGVGKDNLETKAQEIIALPEYAADFKNAFPEEAPAADLIAQAISSYERTIVCSDTKFDKYAAGDKGALSDQEKDGLEVFMGKGMCTACHAPPFFSTAYFGKGTFYNVGIGIEGKEEADVDVGRMKVSEKESDWAAFKVPSLRNITKSAPYFHDGHTSDLKAAVRFMASGGYDNKNKTPLMMDKKLSDEEIDLIVAFLGALECGTPLQQPQK